MSKLLLTLRDKDIFPPETIQPSNNTWSYERTAVRFIVIDNEGRMALLGRRHFLIPGGGVEDGESLEDAVKRECLEEVGCDIDIGDEIGMTVEYRQREERYQETHCFTARVKGEKGMPQTTQEDEIGVEVKWLTPIEAKQALEEHKQLIAAEKYNGNFNVRTHLAFLNEYLEKYAK